MKVKPGHLGTAIPHYDVQVCWGIRDRGRESVYTYFVCIHNISVYIYVSIYLSVYIIFSNLLYYPLRKHNRK